MDFVKTEAVEIVAAKNVGSYFPFKNEEYVLRCSDWKRTRYVVKVLETHLNDEGVYEYNGRYCMVKCDDVKYLLSMRLLKRDNRVGATSKMMYNGV